MHRISITKSDRPGYVLVTDLETGQAELVESRGREPAVAQEVLIRADEDELPGRYHYAP